MFCIYGYFFWGNLFGNTSNKMAIFSTHYLETSSTDLSPHEKKKPQNKNYHIHLIKNATKSVERDARKQFD